MALVSLFRPTAPAVVGGGRHAAPETAADELRTASALPHAGRHAALNDDATVEDAADLLAELGFRYADDRAASTSAMTGTRAANA